MPSGSGDVHESVLRDDARPFEGRDDSGAYSCPLAEDGVSGLVGEWACHGGPTPPKYPRLLMGDEVQGRAQVGLVVEGNGDDGRGQWLARVRRVEPAPEAHLDHRHVDVRPPKMVEGRHRQRLEVGRVGRDSPRANEGVRGPPHLLDLSQQHLVVDEPPVDSDPLVDADEVGRGVEAGAQSRGRSAEATYAATEPLPLVPATSKTGAWASGRPRPRAVRASSRGRT